MGGDDGGVPVRGGEGDEDVGEVADVVFLEGVHEDGHAGRWVLPDSAIGAAGYE